MVADMHALWDGTLGLLVEEPMRAYFSAVIVTDHAVSIRRDRTKP